MKTFKCADILLPNNTDMTKWSVIACDQYTSEPTYWEDVKKTVGSNPSTLNITLPEIYLEDSDVLEKIEKINQNMKNLLDNNFFKTLNNSLIYIERTCADGRIREGLVGMVDLEDYSFEKDSNSLVRATEKTVIERIPPRLKVRKNAYLETPHVMLLIDDEEKQIIEPLKNNINNDDLIYDFDLMKNGGHIKGYKLKEEQTSNIFNILDNMSSKEYFENKYNVKNKGILLFSVGDGNHSLATAKTHYENLKKELSKEEYLNHPARYALVEAVNLHSSALDFEPIHRVLFNINKNHLLEELKKYYILGSTGQELKIVNNGIKEKIYITNPKSNLAVGSIQIFLDEYLANNQGKIDYIHGEDVVENLTKEDNTLGFLLPKMNKNDLFKTVILDGALPRKTFSMGHSYDKRYYLECRKIK